MRFEATVLNYGTLLPAEMPIKKKIRQIECGRAFGSPRLAAKRQFSTNRLRFPLFRSEPRIWLVSTRDPRDLHRLG